MGKAADVSGTRTARSTYGAKERGWKNGTKPAFVSDGERGGNALKLGEERRQVTIAVVRRDELSGTMDGDTRFVHIPRCVVPRHLSQAGIHVGSVLECDVNLRWNKKGRPRAIRIIRVVPA